MKKIIAALMLGTGVLAVAPSASAHTTITCSKQQKVVRYHAIQALSKAAAEAPDAKTKQYFVEVRNQVTQEPC